MEPDTSAANDPIELFVQVRLTPQAQSGRRASITTIGHGVFFAGEWDLWRAKLEQLARLNRADVEKYIDDTHGFGPALNEQDALRRDAIARSYESKMQGRAVPDVTAGEMADGIG